MITVSDIVKRLRNGQNMRDMIQPRNPVTMADPALFVEAEKGESPV
jgi:hypothetical protein